MFVVLSHEIFYFCEYILDIILRYCSYLSSYICRFIYLEISYHHMPDFGNPFAGLKEDRKLTHEELVRAIRFMIAAEYEAIQLYQQLAESIDNKLAIEVLEDIADEEKVHAGEFLRLLYELDPKESDFYQEGADEVEEEIEKLRG